MRDVAFRKQLPWKHGKHIAETMEIVWLGVVKMRDD
jgi:hypothetical protein